MKNIAVVLLLISSSLIGFSQVLDGLYLKENTPERRVVPYSSLREADVLWNSRVWRTIDLREKMNQPLYFPLEPMAGRTSLFDAILKGVNNGTLIAFDDKDDYFSKQLTKDESVAKLVTPKVIMQENPDAPGTMVEIRDTVVVASKDVVEYLLKEDWFFDKQRSVMDVRIIGLCPVIKTFDESGAERGKKKLFWLYFPNCREVFANAETYNRQNDAERRTYDDIFWKRMFSSYITKQNNVYDRAIADYSVGLDALLEGEKIKDEIFTLEMDMWHY